MGSSALPLIICLLFFTHSQTYKDAVYVPQQNRTRTSDEAARSETVNRDLEPSKTETPAETAKPVVKVSPDQPVFIGEEVTLTCHVQTGGNTQWTYRWIKDGNTHNPHDIYSTTSEAQFSFTVVSDTDAGDYSCELKTSSHPQRSVTSDAVTLTVSALPTPTVTVTPDSAVFTGETVNLKCGIKSDYSGWTYEWYKNNTKSVLQSSNGHRNTLTISKAAESDQGQYWCGGRRSGRPNSSYLSSAVSLSVKVPVVTVSPDQRVFTGEKVTLKCDIQTEGNIQWIKYRWFKNGHIHDPYDSYSTTSEAELSFTVVSDTDAGDYSCEGKTSSDPQRSVTSAAVRLNVLALPRSTVTVTPAKAVFTGETVKLTCVIEPKHSGWTYEWYKDNTERVLQWSDGHRDTLTIRGATKSNQGQYWCRGWRSARPNSSQFSSAVSLSVKAKPVVTVSPDQPVFIGETVTLTCDIQTGGSIQWTYRWIKDGSVISYSSERVYSITIVLFANAGQYSCELKTSSDPQRSVTSDAVKLTVLALPTSRVTVTPDSAVFTEETVKLKCVIEPDHSDWTYEWYKDTQRNGVLQTSKLQTLTLTKAAENNRGQYWCKGQRSRRPHSSLSSSAVYLNVTPLPTSRVIVTPASAVFTGETVSLKCVIEPGHSDWTYEWYKSTQRNGVLQTSKLQTLTLTKAVGYNQGQYWCKGQRSRRPHSSLSSSAVYLNVTDLKPKPELRSDPAGAILTGNTVTLTCNTDLSTGWDFYWYKNTQESEIKKTRTNSYRMEIDSVSDGGQYWCRAGRGEPVYYTQYSDQLTLSVTESPKAVMTVRPDKHVFREETVTLRCDIKWGGNTEWTYRWQIDTQQTADKPINPCTRPDCCTSGTNQQHSRTAVSRCSAQELKISRVEVFHRGNYSCTGQMGNQSSQRSDAVALTVSSDEAQTAVRVSPQPWITEGHSVTLICEVPGSSTGWTFSWFRDADHLSDSSRGAGGSYTLSPAALQHTGVYTCRAERGEPAYSSQNSSAQPLWVTGVSASVRLVLRPSRSQHFSSDSLSLSCDSGWTVRRYTHTNTQDCSAQTGSTCGIQSLSTSDTGVYWCESESGEKRHPLNITVHDGDVILESSADSVIEGETLTLHCLHRSTISSIQIADFYKDGSLIQNQTGEMSIPTVSKSDEGFYYCKTESIESPHSWISVRGSSSSLLIIGVSVGLTVFLLLLILLVLLLRHKKKKDPHCGVQPTLVSNPSGESQTDNLTLQSGSDNIYDDVSTVNNKDEEPVADVTYSEVTLKKNTPMNEDENIPGQSNTMYADVGTKAKKPKRKDINIAGPSDMTYAAISKKDKKKTTGKGAGISDVLIEMKSKEKHGGMSSKSGDTLYSELKLNTDGAGADAGGDATYAQVLSKKKKKTRL